MWRISLLATACVLLASAWSQAGFVKIDDFQDRTPGRLDPDGLLTTYGQGMWKADGNKQNVDVEGSNQYLGLGNSGTTGDRTYNNDTAVKLLDNTTGTLFFRLRWASNTDDQAVGWALPADPGTSFSEFAAYIARAGRNPANTGWALSIRDGVTTRTADNVLFLDNEWYNIWIVANSTSNTREVYVSGAGLTGQVQAVNGAITSFGFRNTSAGDLRSFLIRRTSNADYDDIYVDQAGANLANPIPEPATASLLALGALGLLGRRRRA
jgi:hypothetical protein